MHTSRPTVPSIDSAAAAALGWLRDPARQRQMETTLAEWVEISSHTPDAAGCSAVARAIAASLSACGDALGVEVVESQRGFGAHVRAVSRAAGKRILLVGHHDTVFPRASFAGFREDGDLLRGPGVLDMKGGLVVVAYALRALAETGMLAHVACEVLSVSDEEVGSPEGAELVRRACADGWGALVFESGRAGDQIITQRKGTGAVTVRASGRAAHAGNAHHEGKNAIWALAKFIDRAQAITDYARGVTVNVGKIAGGIGKNTVPGDAEALVDFRFVDAAQGEGVMRALEHAAAEAAQAVEGTALAVSGGVGRPPLARSEASLALMAEYGVCARQAGLGADESPLLGGGSDANTVAALGLPAIDGLGPRGRGFHTVDEFIERHSLLPKTEALLHFLLAHRA